MPSEESWADSSGDIMEYLGPSIESPKIPQKASWKASENLNVGLIMGQFLAKQTRNYHVAVSHLSASK